MKAFFAWTALFVAALLFFPGCVTDEGGDGFYYDYEEVMYAWEEGVYDRDPEQQMSAYWPEAEGFFHTRIDREPVLCSGWEEIRTYFENLYGGIDDWEYDLPGWDVLEESEREALVRYDHEELKMVEVLRLVRRGEHWGIIHHEIYPFEPIPVNSPFIAYADEDGSGDLNVAEHDYYMNALFRLLFFPHAVDNDYDEIFDRNGDGYIDDEEQSLFKRYLFRKALPALFKRNPPFAREMADLDGNGRVDGDELKQFIAFLSSYHPDGEDRSADSFPLARRIDRNGDGRIDREEQRDFFQLVFSNLIEQPHPSDPAVDAPEETEEQGSDALAFEVPVDQGITARIQGRRIAVVGIDSMTGKISEDTRKGLVLFVENSFVNTGRVKVVDRNSIEKIIEEYNFQAGGLTDEQTAVEIGKLAGAEIIVTGSISAVGSNYYLQLRLIDVETAEVVASSLGEAKIETNFSI